MKFKTILACSLFPFLAAPVLPADDSIQQLKLQLQQMQED